MVQVQYERIVTAAFKYQKSSNAKNTEALPHANALTITHTPLLVHT